MVHLKYFEAIDINSLINCIENEQLILIKAIPDLVNHNPKTPIRPVSISDDGIVTIEVNGEYYDTLLRNVTRIVN